MSELTLPLLDLCETCGFSPYSTYHTAGDHGLRAVQYAVLRDGLVPLDGLAPIPNSLEPVFERLDRSIVQHAELGPCALYDELVDLCVDLDALRRTVFALYGDEFVRYSVFRDAHIDPVDAGPASTEPFDPRSGSSPATAFDLTRLGSSVLESLVFLWHVARGVHRGTSLGPLLVGYTHLYHACLMKAAFHATLPVLLVPSTLLAVNTTDARKACLTDLYPDGRVGVTAASGEGPIAAGPAAYSPLTRCYLFSPTYLGYSGYTAAPYAVRFDANPEVAGMNGMWPATGKLHFPLSTPKVLHAH